MILVLVELYSLILVQFIISLRRHLYSPDEESLRASAGIGLSWLSPFGPVKFYLSKALLKENYDKKEIFRFSFGTTY